MLRSITTLNGVITPFRQMASYGVIAPASLEQVG
jgi:hypothetical protein